ncbi:uncharacterized protein LOC126678333 [Mercurialis annua]|uniref:uncharacterized protein LOC126678333 n=1 Tax=Mercurialis annua TaxID=3986 RepID=UPI002160C48B|nr:uncharacterized protein LOC126678333 [Mercurialis annua]
MTDEKSALAVSVLSEKWPQRLKIPNFDNFDGTSCPESHVTKYYNKMVLLDVSNTILCKMFPTTPTATAQRLCNSLKDELIAMWRQLNKEFVIRFFTNILPKRSTEELYMCKQGKGETLRAYIERFNNKAMKIEDLNNESMVQTLKKGTLMGVIGDKLSLKKPKTYQEVMQVAHKCINVDDRRRQKTSDAPKKEKNKGSASQRQSSHSQHDYGMSHRSISRYGDRAEAFTPLNTTRANILMWVKENRTSVTWPRKMIHRTGTRDENRYCQFHEDCRHDIEECYDLKKEIEKMIESGALRRFTSRKEDKHQRIEGTDKEEKKEEERRRKKEIAGVINVIVLGKSIREGRKK